MVASEQQLLTALRNAHQAGDVAAARRIAAMLREAQGALQPKGLLIPTATPGSTAPADSLMDQGIGLEDHLKTIGGAGLQGLGGVLRGTGETIRETGNILDTAYEVATLQGLPGEEEFAGDVGSNIVSRAGDYWMEQGREVSESISPAAKKAMEGSAPSGDITDPSSWSAGENPSVQGYLLQMEKVFGQMAPQVLGVIATRGRSAMRSFGVPGALAGASEGGFAYYAETERILNMDQKELAQIPLYQELQKELSPEQARKELAVMAGRGAFRYAAPIGALSGVGGAIGISDVAQRALARVVGSGRITRALATGVVEAPLEAAQEVSVGVGSRLGASQATGEERDLTEGTFAEAALGAGVGGSVGLASGLATRAESPQPTQDSPSARPPPDDDTTQESILDRLGNVSEEDLAKARAPGSRRIVLGRQEGAADEALDIPGVDYEKPEPTTDLGAAPPQPPGPGPGGMDYDQALARAVLREARRRRMEQKVAENRARRQQEQAEQQAPEKAPKPKDNRKEIQREDTLQAAIAKLGGLNREALEADGFELPSGMRDEVNNPAMPSGKRLMRTTFPKKGGDSLDGMAEALQQYSPVRFREGSRTEDLYDLLDRMLAGETIFLDPEYQGELELERALEAEEERQRRYAHPAGEEAAAMEVPPQIDEGEAEPVLDEAEYEPEWSASTRKLYDYLTIAEEAGVNENVLARFNADFRQGDDLTAEDIRHNAALVRELNHVIQERQAPAPATDDAAGEGTREPTDRLQAETSQEEAGVTDAKPRTALRLSGRRGVSAADQQGDSGSSQQPASGRRGYDERGGDQANPDLRTDEGLGVDARADRRGINTVSGRTDANRTGTGSAGQLSTSKSADLGLVPADSTTQVTDNEVSDVQKQQQQSQIQPLEDGPARGGRERVRPQGQQVYEQGDAGPAGSVRGAEGGVQPGPGEVAPSDTAAPKERAQRQGAAYKDMSTADLREIAQSRGLSKRAKSMGRPRLIKELEALDKAGEIRNKSTERALKKWRESVRDLAGKKPWEMTREEYRRATALIRDALKGSSDTSLAPLNRAKKVFMKVFGARDTLTGNARHEVIVTEALKQGKQVPERVQAEYRGREKEFFRYDPPDAVDEARRLLAGKPEITNPIDPNATAAEQLDQIKELTAANKPIVDSVLEEIDEALGTESSSNIKTRNSILEKATRPSILAEQPGFGIEHVRDTLRFKTVVDRFQDIEKAIDRVVSQGWEIVKADTGKMLSPKRWGWRMVALDLRMPNGQLVEYYLPIRPMEKAKKAGNHDLYEKWRTRDLTNLSPEETEEYRRDVDLSWSRYDRAFDQGLADSGMDLNDLRASLSSLEAKLSSVTAKKSFDSIKGKAIPDRHSPSTREAEKPPGPRTSTREKSSDAATTASRGTKSFDIESPREDSIPQGDLFNKPPTTTTAPKRGIIPTEEAREESNNELQDSVLRGNEREGAEDAAGATAQRPAGSTPSGENARGASDDKRPDRGRSEAAKRPAQGAVPDAGTADGDGDLHNLPAGELALKIKGVNFHIDSLQEARGPKQKARDNVRAIELLHEIEARGGPATKAEQEQLSLYVGWGGIKGAFPDSDGKYAKGFEDIGRRVKALLSDSEYATARRSIQYAHYTSQDVIGAMWDIAARLGFEGGQVFEPGMGVGHFAGLMPADMAAHTSYHGLELDHTTARIAKLLYPEWGVRQDDYTRAPVPKDSYDLVIGNPPFADIPIKSDPDYPQNFLLHDYFFAKSLDSVRPGGLLAFVSSAGTMNKIDDTARKYLGERAILVGAIRLPSSAFKKSAGTEVTTDIIVLRKRTPADPAPSMDWTETVEVTLPTKDGGTQPGRVSRYFVEHPEMVLGEEGFYDTLYPNRYGVRPTPGADLKTQLEQAVTNLPVDVGITERPDLEARVEMDFGTTEVKEGGYYMKGSQLMQQRGGVGVPVELRGKGVKGGKTRRDVAIIKKLIPIRDTLRAVYRADMNDDAATADLARKALNRAYDAFSRTYGPINKAIKKTRRPNVLEQERARMQAREDARYAGQPFMEGDFDPTPMIEEKASLSKIAQARKAAREASPDFDEGSFNPEDMANVVTARYPNIDPFMDDQESYRLRSIENYDDDTGKAEKRAVFYESAFVKERTPEINSVNDAVLFVLNRHGRFDIGKVATAAGMTESEAIEALGNKIFRLPGTSNTWVMRDEYLSGNVRSKLRQAMVAAERDPSFQSNVEALEAVMPVPLTPGSITANLGMPWIPEEIIEQFGRDALGLESIAVQHNRKMALWEVHGDDQSAAARVTWGSERAPAVRLIEDALNSKDTRVLSDSYNEHGQRTRVVNAKLTEAARDKKQEIKARFSRWMWEDSERAAAMAELYNEINNSVVERQFDGSYLEMPGVASDWKWRAPQLRVISRIIQTGNTHIAHGVGSGKTSDMIGAAMEMRRLGLVNKPMFTVPNHMLEQFATEFYQLYPTAQVMVADKRKFHTSRRKQFVADAASQDVDAIIITHSAFGLIPVSNEFSNGLIEEELDEYRELLADQKNDQDSRITRARLENQIERLEQRLSGNKRGNQDQVFTFEEMGVDFLFVDEAHEFRKLDFATKMSDLKGVDPVGSKKAWDLFVKTRYLNTVNPGRNLALASGTPITNTMAELYTVSRFIQPDELERRGLAHFDAWAASFGEAETKLEQNVGGGYSNVTRFQTFVNAPELSLMVRQRMDVLTNEQVGQYMTRPAIKGGEPVLHNVPASDAFKAYQQSLNARLDAIKARKGPPKPGDDIVLSVINDGKKAAVDIRLVDATAGADTASKLTEMVDEIYRIWQETKRQKFYKPTQGGYSSEVEDVGPATQIVFTNLGHNSEGFSVPQYIRSELQRRGVPKKEIAYINDYKSDVMKQRMFNDMNEGKVRILMGSVKKMGTGLNVQKRLYALHKLDPEWYPADYEQAVGRIVRQGNMNPEVEVHNYATKGSYDSAMWGMMGRKAKFIEMFFRGDPALRVIEDLGEASMYEQAQAMTTADPRLIELTELRQNLEKALRRKSAFEQETGTIQQTVATSRNRVEYYDKRIAAIQKDIAQRRDTKGDAFTAVVDGKTYKKRVKAGDAVMGVLGIMENQGDKEFRDVKIGRIGGFDIIADVYNDSYNTDGQYLRRAHVSLGRAGGYDSAVHVGSSAAGLVQSMESTLRSFDSELEKAQDSRDQAARRVEEFTPQLADRAFGGDAEIAELREKLEALEAELSRDVQELEEEVVESAEVDEDQDDVMYSVGSGRGATHTVESLREALSRQFRPFQRLERAGIVEVVSTLEDVPVSATDAQAAREGVVVEGKSQGGKIWLVAENIARGEELGAFLHEAAHRSAKGRRPRLREMLGVKFDELTQRFDELVAEGDEAALRAVERVKAAKVKASRVPEEHLAYLVQEVTNADRKAGTISEKARALVRRIIAEIRAWFYKTPFAKAVKAWGYRMKLSAQDIAALARQAARKAARESGEAVHPDRATGAMFSRSDQTRRVYEQRIDELLAGESPARQGVKVLDRADILDLLGHGDKPLHLAESKVAAGKRLHGLTADDWKKMPEWVENPVAVFRSQTRSGRLVLFAPELVNGRPVRIIIEPDSQIGGLKVHVLVNAYDEIGTHITPVDKWVKRGDLLYLDQQTSPAFSERSGLRLPGDVRQLRGYKHRVLTELDVVKYRAGQGQAPNSVAARPREFGLPPAADPPIQSYRNATRMKAHPDYQAAKDGDVEAARRLVGDLVSRDSLETARQRFDNDTIFLPVRALEAGGDNAIPHALAQQYGDATGGRVEADTVVQANRVFHTGANAAERMISRPVFAGPVSTGARYVLVDDVTTLGGTLAELANHIRANGGEVVGTVTLVNASRSRLSSAPKHRVRLIERRFGDAIQEIFQIEPSALTAAEAEYVLNFRNADALRNRAAKANREREERLLARGIRPAQEEISPPDTLYSVSARPGLDTLDEKPVFEASGKLSESAMDVLRRQIADKMRPVLLAERAIQDATDTEIDDEYSAYVAETLFHGKVKDRLEAFEQRYYDPIVQAVADSGLSLEQVGLYLIAKHAPSRNAHIAEINPEFREKGIPGSGMSDEEAQAILDQAEQDGTAEALERISALVDAMNAYKLDLLRDYGLVSEAELDAWREYAHYVPLLEMGQDEGGLIRRIGKGFSIGGKESKRATGRFSMADPEYVLQNAMASVENAIIRGEKNQVAMRFLNLVMDHPNTALWEISPTVTQPVVDPETGEVRYRAVNADNNFMERYKDKYLSVKVKGREYHIAIKHPGLLAAMKNVGPEKMGSLLRSMAGVQRWLAMSRTALSPEFVISNFSRDLQTAMIHLSGEQAEGVARKVAKRTLPAVRGAWDFMRDRDTDSEWGQWMRDLSRHGGTTGFFGMDNTTRRKRKLNWSVKLAKGGVYAPLRGGKAGVDFVMDANSAVENGVRLATYRTLVEGGTSKTKAAKIAKELTVNFNRRGEAGTAINALYLFFNAALQGSLRSASALAKSKKVRRIAAGIGVAGFLHAELMRQIAEMDGGDDEDDEWQYGTPQWMKDRYLTILNPANPDDKFTLPLAYGYNAFFVLGQELNSVVHGQDPMEAAADVVSATWAAYFPLGGDSSALTTIAPTLADPFVRVAQNQTYFGGPVMPEVNKFADVPKPDSERYFKSVYPAFVGIADMLNAMGGGSQFREGDVLGVETSVSPETLEHLWDFATGAAGTQALQVLKVAGGLTPMADMPPVADVPFAGAVYRSGKKYQVRDRYYEAEQEIQTLEAELDNLKAQGHWTEAREFQRQHQDVLRLRGRLRSVSRYIADLYDRLDRAEKIQNEGRREKRIEQIREKMLAARERFSTRYNRAVD